MTVARKAPLNQLIGKLVQDGRHRASINEVVLAKAIGITPSYLRGIESGAVTFPLSKAVELSNRFDWNYDLLLHLLAAASICDKRLEGTRRSSNIAQIEPLYAQHSLKSKTLAFVWEWALIACDLDVRNSSEFERTLSGTLAKLVLELASGVAPGKSAASISRLAAEISPFMANPVERLRRMIEDVEATLRVSIPVMGVEGLKLFDDSNRSEILSVITFIGYEISPDDWRASPFDFRFFLNRHKPSLTIYCEPETPQPQELDSLLDDMLRDKLAPEKGSRRQALKTRKFVTSYSAGKPFKGKLQFNLGSRSWRYDASRREQEVTFSNAWVYEVKSLRAGQPAQHLAVLDDYDPAFPSEAAMGVALSPRESMRLLEMLRPT